MERAVNGIPPRIRAPPATVIAQQTHQGVPIFPIIARRPYTAPSANARNFRRLESWDGPFDSLESPSDLHAYAAAFYASTFLLFLPFRYGHRAREALTATEALGTAPPSLDNIDRPAARTWKAFVKRLSLEYASTGLFSIVAFITMIKLEQVAAHVADVVVVKTLGILAATACAGTALVSIVFAVHIRGLRRPSDAPRWAQAVNALKHYRFRSPAIILSIPTAWLLWTTALVASFAVAWVTTGRGHQRPEQDGVPTHESLPMPAIAIIFIFAAFTFFHIVFNIAQLRKMGYDEFS